MKKLLQKTIRTWLWLMVLLVAPGAWAQVSFTGSSLTISQNLDALPASGTPTFSQNTTVPGIYGERTGNGTTIVANDGGNNAGNLYSYGTGTTTDRALGSVGSGGAGAGNFTYGFRLKNETGVAINSLRVQYTGEQWRNGATAAQTASFSYLISSAAITTTTPATALPAGYVAVPGLDFTSPITGGSAGALNGNLAANRTAKDVTLTVSIPAGSEIMLRWYDIDHTGADHGLSIDDLSITATTAGPVTPMVSLSVSSNTATENPAQTVTLTATASAPVVGDQTIVLSTSGSATPGSDYFIGVGDTEIKILNGQTQGSTSFNVINDTDVEGTETAIVSISSVTSGLTLGTPISQTITITDDDAPVVPTVSIAATDATGAEAASDPITFTITRTGDVTNSLTVNYTVGGQATNGTDYTPMLTGTVTIPASQSSIAITLTPTDDNAVEGSETIQLSLTDDAAYDLGAVGTATATITDNEVAPGTRIRDIQGNGHISPLASTTVSNVPGIVTVLRSNGFWMQDPTPDADDNTSEGIFVFTSSASGRTVGESVTVSGTVQEFRANVQNLSITQLTSPTVTVVSTGNALPAPMVISSQAGAGVRRIPTNTISNDFPADGDVELSVFDPAEDGLDFFETLEGMRVQINNPVTTSNRNGFGEIFVIADGGAGATGLNSRKTLTISGTNTTDINSAITNSDFNPERIQIDDVLYGTGGTPNENVGTTLNTIIGVVSYDFQSYEILPSVAPTVSGSNVPLTKESTTLLPTTNQLTVASFNVENLGGTEGQAKFDGLALGIKNSLGSPDILALEEIQDNDGATNSSDVDASTTLNRLINAITAAGGPTYQFRQINPVDDQDGGQPGGNIRVGILFNPARVQFVDRAGGGPTVNTTVSNVGGQPQLSSSPGRILDTNPGESDSYAGDDFTATRKPLVGELTFNGQPVYLIVNHFSSRGGSGSLTQRFQPPLQEEQGRREEQGKLVNAFVDQLLAVNPNANVVVAGDFNEFQFLPALQYLKGNDGGNTPVLTNLIESLPAEERYTYTFDGNAQALDYVLGSNAMNSKLDAYDAVHLNAGFLDQLSDHDPSVVRFNFAPVVVTPLALTFTASPTMILTTGTTTLSATVSGGSTPYSYTFSGPGTITPNGNTAMVSNLPAGVQTFTVRVADATSPTSQTISATVSVTVTAANTAPTVANAIPPQSATVGQAFSYVIPAGTFTDAETPNSLTLSVSGLPAGLNFTAPATISGTPSTTVGSPFTVSVTATDPGSLSVSTTFTITVQPAAVVATPLALTFTASPTMILTTGTTTLSATVSGGSTPYSYTFSGPGTITPNGNTATVSNLPAGVQTLTVRVADATSPTSQTISATVSVTVSAPAPMNTAPTVANAIPPQSATVGQGFSYVIPAGTFTDAETPNNLVLSVSGLPAGLSFTAPATISGTPSTTVGSPFTVSVTATDPGSLSVSTSFAITVSPAGTTPTPTGPFAITGVTTVSCTTISAGERGLTFNPQYAGVTGQPITFRVVNELAATTNAGPYTLRLFTDNPVIGLRATQAGTAGEASFSYNWLAACNGGTPPTNTAPTVANAIPPQSATVGQGFSYVIPAGTFTDAETPNNLVLSVSGLPAGLSFTAPATISGTPSTTVGSPFTVSVTATDPGNLSVSTSFAITVSPAGMNPTPTGPFAITGVTTVSCTTISAGERGLTFNPQYAGVTGQPITFRVVNELAATTNAGPYTLRLFTDNPVIGLRATQAGTAGEASFSYNWLAACNGGTPPANTAPTVANAIPPQSATVGQGFSYVIPAGTFTDAETPNSLVLSVSGLPTGLSFTAPATISGTPSVTGTSTVTVTATDPGSLSASTTFTITVSPAGTTPTPTGPFAITSVTTVSCSVISAGERSLTFNPQYAGVTGQPITFRVVNELAATTNAGPYTLRLFTDNPVISLRATQSGTAGEATFSYNWLAACNSGGRVGAERVAPLQVRVLGNPVHNVVEAEVTGAEGRSLNLTLTDEQGRTLNQHIVERAGSTEKVRFNVGNRSTGVLLLRATTPTQTQTIRLLKAE